MEKVVCASVRNCNDVHAMHAARHTVGVMTADSKGSVSKICLFVQNIPYSTTDSELEEVFKAYGPLKACYTVKDKG